MENIPQIFTGRNGNCGFDYRAQLESQDMRISEVQIDVLAFDLSIHESLFTSRQYSSDITARSLRLSVHMIA